MHSSGKGSYWPDLVPLYSGCSDVVVGGVPVSLLDTAGMRQTSDVVERLGVQRSRATAVQADVAIVVLDAQVFYGPMLCHSVCPSRTKP